MNSSSIIILHIYSLCIVHNYNSLQEIINFLRKASYGATYATAMSAPVAQMVLSTMKIIMGEDGTNDGKDRITH